MSVVQNILCVLVFVGLSASASVPARNISRANHQLRPFNWWDPTFCEDREDWEQFPYPDNCWDYFLCYGGEVWLMQCEEHELFDPWLGICDDAEWVVCLDDENGDHDPWCPPPWSDELRFVPSWDCNAFYICISGQRVLQFCAPNQHWNAIEQFCDDPGNAGCDLDAPPPIPPLPNCPAQGTVTLPHPYNCNQFIHCANGNRSIQRCQHLHHYDAIQGRCLLKTVAQCIVNM